MGKKENKEEDIFVFVYGTLKRGGSNHRYLDVEGSEFIEEATIPAGTFKMLNIANRYPALIVDNDGPAIHGEVYKITNKVLQVLHILENFYPDHKKNLFDCYKIKINNKDIHIYLAGNQLVDVINSVKNAAQIYPEIPSGNWEIQKQ